MAHLKQIIVKQHHDVDDFDIEAVDKKITTTVKNR
jgi:hypothetical protein